MAQQIDALLHEMDMLLNSGKGMRIGDWAMVSKTKMSDLIQNINASLPDEIKRARNIIENESKIISEARTQAENEIAEASAQSRKTIDDAVRSAQMTLQNAQVKAEEMYRTASEQHNRAISDANMHANQLVLSAEAQAKEMVEQETITARANAEAKEKLEEARIEMDSLKNHMFSYLDMLLDDADKMLSEKLQGIRDARDDLRAQE